MKVVVNQLAASGRKTGIGHYTVELLRCLQEQAGLDEVTPFPQGWFWRLREAGARLRCRVEADTGLAAARPLASRALDVARRCGRAVTAAYFRLHCRQQRFDLYHETNFIPLPCDRL